ncbi:MAG: M18 family aminopeptidase [Candidatus Marinimicrobia bacterium]|nr:M18 family aminopeptidase [Candidatus Neomarinimicrobiota bacterium]
MEITQEMRNRSADLKSFLDNSPTAGWAAKSAENILKQNGFRQVDEKEKWKLQAGDKFFINRGGSAIAAGVIGQKSLAESGFNIIGSHTDSPGFRVKSKSVYEKENYIQLGVEIYGGPLLASWTDRELSLAGKIVIEEADGLQPKMWRSQDKLLRIAQLPIHMNREVNDEGLKLEKEKHLPPILGLAGEEEFTRENLIALIAEDMEVEKDRIKEFELELYDTQKASLLGLNNEFIASGRIDNLMMCYSAISALTELDKTPEKTAIVILFDNEEIGSNTMNGGGSPFLQNFIERIAISQNLSREELLVAMANSFVLSADGAHAVHPNYPDEYEKRHKVELNNGPVIKLNAMQKYASNPENTAYFKSICEKLDIPHQIYIHRTDKPCGSTIGPITATRTGMRTMDVGPAMLSMHSVREMAGVADTWYMIQVMQEILRD